jgi:hypothetical protein
VEVVVVVGGVVVKGGGDRVWGGAGNRGKLGSDDVAHCEGGERTRVPHRIPPPLGFGEARTDSPPVLIVIYEFIQFTESQPD